MAIKKFNKKSLDVIRKDINSALESVSKKHGIVLSFNSMSYSDSDFSTRLQAVIPDARVAGEDPYHVQLFNELKKAGHYYNLSEADHKKVVTLLGEKYRFMGLKPNGRATPIIMMHVASGKLYRFDTDHQGQDLTALIRKGKV